MLRSMENLDRRRAKRILKVQAVVALVFIVVGQLLGEDIGMAALIGAVIAAASNALFALGVFGQYRAEEPGGLLFKLYAAELIKLLVVALAFAGTFLWIKPLNVPVLFGVFFVVQILPPLLTHAYAEQIT